MLSDACMNVPLCDQSLCVFHSHRQNLLVHGSGTTESEHASAQKVTSYPSQYLELISVNQIGQNEKYLKTDGKVLGKNIYLIFLAN